MRVGVREAQGQVADGAVRAHLKGMIYGVSPVADAQNLGVARIGRVVGSNVVAACDRQIYHRLSSDIDAVHGSGYWQTRRGRSRGLVVLNAGTIWGSYGSTSGIRIVSSRNRVQLVQVLTLRKLRAFTAHVGDGQHDMTGQFVLDAKVPLLDVRPFSGIADGNGGRRSDSWGRTSASRPDVRVTVNQTDCACEHGRSAAILQGF